MHNYIATIFIVSFSVFMLVFNSNLSTYSRSSQFLKEDLEIAVHDASLMLNESEYANGLVVIDETRAREKFEESLKLNANLDPEDYEVLDFQIFDNSNTTFPVDYTLNGSDFEETIEFPTVVVAVKAESGDYFNIFNSKPVSRIASYSYKVENKDPVTNLPIIDSNPSSYGFLWAVPYTTNITSMFSPQRVHPITGEITFHKGIDIASSGVLNQPVIAVKNGTVSYAGVMNGYGNIVEINHGSGLVTRYAHLNSIGVSLGSTVSAGQVIGRVGSTGRSTGPHLHFETIVNGTHVDPLNFYD